MIYISTTPVGSWLSLLERPAQAQGDFLSELPGWMWLLIGLIVIAIGVMWTLWEESEAAKKELPAAVRPEPVLAVAPAPAVEARPAAEVAPGPPAPPPKPDDLKRISGIGPKIMRILNEQGIFTFEQLAATEVSFLEQLLAEREWHMADPTTWPAQARELAEKRGKLD